MSAKDIAEQILGAADITIDGDNPWDIAVHDERFYKRTLRQGTLGFGESYMDGWWDCPQIDQLVDRAFRANLVDKIKLSIGLLKEAVPAYAFNMANRARAFKIGEAHYDVGNDLYERMLDKRMVYTCGYWKNASNLDEAQEAKLDLVCKKIGLKAGDKVLDIGCGWGSFAKFAAEKYGAHVVGVTVSKEQVELGNKLCEGLPVEIRLQDYRDVNEPFDHIVSLGMVEHVGVKNYRAYMEVAERCLSDDGLFLLHTIGAKKSGFHTDPWIGKYIFPNSMLPSVKQIAKSIEGLFLIEDLHNFGADYDKTLMAWHSNFVEHWDEIKDQYSDRFFRMWSFYLLCCAGSFRARNIELWQIVLSKHGVPGGYTSVR